MQPRKLLVDADMLCYLSQDPDEPAQYVLHSVRLMLEDMMEKTKAKEMRVFLSSSTNFRYDVDPDYKISRRDVPKPPHYETTKNYLKKYYDAEVAPDGLEADDYIAQLQMEDIDKTLALYEKEIEPNYTLKNKEAFLKAHCNTCIASLDKDFLTISGWHYKWRHHNAGNLYWVDDDDAEAFLCYQLLTGDKADSIISPLKKRKANGELGKVGFGHVAARDFLLQHDYEEMRMAVFHEYKEQGHELEFDKNYKLLAIGRITDEQIKSFKTERS